MSGAAVSLDLEALDRLAQSARRVTLNARAQIEPRETEPIALLDGVLAHLSADVGRGTGSIEPDNYWFGTILAAQREWGPAAEPQLRAWSQSSPRYDEASFNAAWSQYDPNHPNPVTIKSVFRFAEGLGWKRPASSSRYQLLDRSRIMTLKPIEWLVKGIFPKQGIGAIFGPSGSGKSFLTLDLALRLAAGEDWFGRKTRSCPVTYVMLEGEAGLRNRIEAWEQANGKMTPSNFAGVPQGFSLADRQDIEDLAVAVPKGGVVMIDTFNRAAPGKDENSSKDMGEVLEGMKRLQKLTEGLVLIVHHTGKDAGKGMRGHSSLHAALDGAIEVRRDGTHRSWKAAKVKDGSDDFEVPFVLDEVCLGRDADGELITSCVARFDPQRTAVRKEPGGKRQQAVLNVIRSHGAPLTRADAIQLATTAFDNPGAKRSRYEANQQVSGLLTSGYLVIDETGCISPG